MSAWQKFKQYYRDHASAAFFIGCLIGSLIFVCIYGIRILDVTYDAWLSDSSQCEKLWDLTQHYLGWIYYRKSPWHFPIGLLDGLYSESVSILYTDSIPLFAVFFKLLSPILPETFQYFGIFGLICYALMGGFGVLFLRRRVPYALPQLIGGAFFVLSPCLLKRTFYHTALSAHFLILAAICLWAYRQNILRSRRGRLRYTLLWCLLGMSSFLINPYLTPMVFGVLACSLLQECLLRRNWLDCLAGLFAPALATLSAGYLIGAFYGNVSAASPGLENLSFNLLQLFNPANYLLEIPDFHYTWEKQNYSSLLPALPSFSEWQEEGFSYLGLGVILMLVLCGILFICRTVRLHRKSATPPADNVKTSVQPSAEVLIASEERNGFYCSIWIYYGVFTLLALSPRITIGNVKLLEITYPAFVYHVLSIFRSTGRFAWMLHYGLLALALIVTCQFLSTAKHGRRLLSLTLAALLLMQIVDLSPALADKHEAYTKEFADYTSPFQSSGWKILGENATQIMVCPPTGTYGLYNAPDVSCHLEHYALQYGLSLNVTYMSRDFSKAADAATAKHLQTRKNGEKHPEIIYVFLQESTVPPAEESGLNYYEMDGYIIGTDLGLDSCPDVSPYARP